MPPDGTTREAPPRRSALLRRLCVGAALFAFASVAYVTLAPAQPDFPDETAYVAQTYFWELAQLGRVNDWDWISYHAYDLPPLPKYIAGAALQLAGHRLGTRSAANAWFLNIRARVMPLRSIIAARWPFALLGAAGCACAFVIATLAADARAGVLAAVLIGINPLYRLLAMRVMSDVPAECATLAAEALGLWLCVREWRGGRKRWFPLLAVSGTMGALAGFALLSKLNGLLAVIVIAAWALCGCVAPGRERVQRLRFVVIGLVLLASCLGTFVLLNPYTTAHPQGAAPDDVLVPAPAIQSVGARLALMVAHRVDASRQGQANFVDDALRGLPQKAAAVAVQGFGRFGPLGPAHDSLVKLPRYALDRDWGAMVWLPGVLASAGFCCVLGWRQWRRGECPVGWAVVAWFGVTGATVTLFIPLAWDRYFLPMVPVSSVVAAMGICAAFDAIRGVKKDASIG